MSRQAKIHLPIKSDFIQALTAIANENMPVKTFSAHPFIKWVGGKRSIINELLQRIPKQYSSYHEPFLGGGALFFALNPESAFLSDINFYLMITYTSIRDNIEEVIYNLKTHKKNHTLEYYQVDYSTFRWGNTQTQPF